MENRSISLREEDASLIDRLVDEGRYDSAADVVHAGVELVARRERGRKELHTMLDEAEVSGFKQLNRTEFVDSLKRDAERG